MNSPPNGRALAFPVVWGAESGSRVAGPQPAEVRSPSDEDLMAWMQAKDSKGLDLLYTRYSRLVFGIALRILNDKSEAEEVVQEVFFWLYQKALLFNPAKGSAKGWVVQIAFSRARDRRAHLLRRGFYSGTDLESLDDTLPGRDDVEREVGLRIDCSHLLSAFEDLTANAAQNAGVVLLPGSGTERDQRTAQRAIRQCPAPFLSRSRKVAQESGGKETPGNEQ